uniref:Uncharacterized protein n=1 Tax=Anguilla anguilla TaxID=7936 RepID=A0A0E9TAL6_ANGAN
MNLGLHLAKECFCEFPCSPNRCLPLKIELKLCIVLKQTEKSLSNDKLLVTMNPPESGRGGD